MSESRQRRWRAVLLGTAGTRSVLYGVHCFCIHPIIVALGWYRAFGWSRIRIGTEHQEHAILDETVRGTSVRLRANVIIHRGIYASLFDPRLWLAFVVHDIGLIGKPDMDGPIGETHPEVGARIMRTLFGDAWGDLVLLHSRYYAKRLDRPVSPLCIADKWAIVVEPTWLYLPRAWASGELREYMENGYRRAVNDPAGLTHDEWQDFRSLTAHRWHRACRSYMKRWLAEHATGGADTWTRVRHVDAATATAPSAPAAPTAAVRS